MTLFKMIRELKRVNLHQITNTYSTETIFKIIGVYVTPLFIYLKCSANTATVIALIVGLSAGITHIIFGYESYHICISLFLLSVIIDFCDGSIARLTNTPSFFGRFMDGLFGILVIGFLQISIFYNIITDYTSYKDIYDYFNYDVIFILALISIFLTPIQHLIYDRYSTFIRWINEEHGIDLKPTLRYEISFKIINLLDDICLMCLIFGLFWTQLFLIYFIVNLFLSFYLIVIHVFFAGKNMKIFAEDHRKINK